MRFTIPVITVLILITLGAYHGMDVQQRGTPLDDGGRRQSTQELSLYMWGDSLGNGESVAYDGQDNRARSQPALGRLGEVLDAEPFAWPSEVVALNVPRDVSVLVLPRAPRQVQVTFYTCETGFCTVNNLMYSGVPAYEGAAACSWEMPIGTVFSLAGDPDGRNYACLDRGNGPRTSWVDIYFKEEKDGWTWQEQIGSKAYIAYH